MNASLLPAQFPSYDSQPPPPPPPSPPLQAATHHNNNNIWSAKHLGTPFGAIGDLNQAPQSIMIGMQPVVDHLLPRCVKEEVFGNALPPFSRQRSLTFAGGHPTRQLPFPLISESSTTTAPESPNFITDAENYFNYTIREHERLKCRNRFLTGGVSASYYKSSHHFCDNDGVGVGDINHQSRLLNKTVENLQIGPSAVRQQHNIMKSNQSVAVDFFSFDRKPVVAETALNAIIHQQLDVIKEEPLVAAGEDSKPAESPPLGKGKFERKSTRQRALTEQPVTTADAAATHDHNATKVSAAKKKQSRRRCKTTESAASLSTKLDLKKVQELYKTEMCRSFEETGKCKYGGKCHFAHSAHEIRPVKRHPRYKTEVCKTFTETGTCPYGKRCCFIHEKSGSSSSPASTSNSEYYNSSTSSNSGSEN